jgi:hypothetical protein
MLLRIALALFVHMKGLGCSLCTAMNWEVAASSSRTLSCEPRLVWRCDSCSDRPLEKRSHRVSTERGLKCKAQPLEDGLFTSTSVWTQ